MKTIASSFFKAQAVRVVERVARSREPIVISRRGEAGAQVVRYGGGAERPVPGRLAHTLVCEKDLVSALGEELLVK